MAFEKIQARDIPGSVFKLIGDEWMLITAGDESALNTMTASWGGLGVLWGKNVATCYIRPQRHTLGFVEKSDYFTLSFFDAQYKPQLALCGSKSGRDVDKVKACGFTAHFSEQGAPFFEEARLVLVCRKLYWDDIEPARFIDPDIQKNYPINDYHRMFIGEIAEVLIKG